MCNIASQRILATFAAMLVLLSPSKTIDLSIKCPPGFESLPEFREESENLIEVLRLMSITELKRKMKLSDALSEKVSGWHIAWKSFKNIEKAKISGAKPCAFVLKGEAFKSFDAHTLSSSEIKFAQSHILILSGLYGALRINDLIMPYRLELGQSFKPNNNARSLYAFWQMKIAAKIPVWLKTIQSNTIINLASEEYSKVITRSELRCEIISCIFKEETPQGLKTISTFAKQARGAMARYIVTEKIKDPEKLKQFDYLQYRFRSDLSTPEEMIFSRRNKQVNK